MTTVPFVAMQRREFLRGSVSTVAALAIASPPRVAQGARDSELRILCSGPAGSIPDLVARSVGEQLPITSGARTWIDNRPGAGGQISAVTLKTAPPDGSTLLLAQGAIATVLPSLYPTLGYDPAVDLRPVSLASEMSLGLAVGPAVPHHVGSLAEFIDWARAHPNDTNVGSPGAGTLPHLLAVLLFQGGGTSWQHVAYAGGPPALTALLGGHLAALVLPEGLLRQHHAARRVRVLATSGAARSGFLPGVRSFAEQGRPDLVITEWFAFFAPGSTANEVVERASADLQKAIASPAVVASFAQSAMTPVSCTPQALSARIAAEQRVWQPLIRRHGIRAE